TRSWTSLAATVSSASFLHPASVPFTLSATGLEVAINTTSADSKYVDLSSLPGGGLSVSTGTGSRQLNYHEALVQASVSGAALDVDGFVNVTVSGGFGIRKTSNALEIAASGVTASLSAGSAQVGVTSATLAALIRNDDTVALEASGQVLFNVPGF